MSLPSPIAQRKCPFCGFLFSYSIYEYSSHIELGMTWTDGANTDNVRLPNTKLVYCECKRTYMLEEADLVGLDNLGDEVKDGLMNGRPVDEVFDYLKSAALKGFKGSSLRHNTSNYYDHYLPLPGFQDNYIWFEFIGYGKPSINMVLENKLYTTPKEELETRIELFWSTKRTINWGNTSTFIKDTSNFKKYIRAAIKPLDECTSDDNDLLRSFVLSEEAALNIIKLLELWVIVPEYNSGNLAYGIMKADMFRQLGRFEDCLVVLNSVKSREILLNSNCSEWDRTINSDDYTNIINLIEQSCNEKIRCPRKIVIGDGDASDRNINSDDYDDLSACFKSQSQSRPSIKFIIAM